MSRIFLTLFLWILPVLALSRSAGTGPFQDPPPEELSPCDRIIHNNTFIDPTRADGILITNPMSLDLSRAVEYLELSYGPSLFGIRDENVRHKCEQRVIQVRDWVRAFIEARASLVLQESGAKVFWGEIWALLHFLSPQVQIVMLDLLSPQMELWIPAFQEDFAKTVAELNESVDLALASIVPWTEDWSEQLGPDAEAGVNFRSRTIAFKNTQYTYGELQVKYFHELSHLMDTHFQKLIETRNPTKEEQDANELFAWEKTIPFQKKLASSGRLQSQAFQERLELQEKLGLKTWVSLLCP